MAIFVKAEARSIVPTIWGDLELIVYSNSATDDEHIVALSPKPPVGDPLARVHSECITGEIFGSLKCDCGDQLQDALKQIATNGGAVVYLRGQEGRGIGLSNKIRAYKLQEDGLDTIDANLELGLPVDNRDFTVAAAILLDLGFKDIRLITNNPAKVDALKASGVNVTEVVPQIVGITEENENYLSTKRDRLGHTLPRDLGHEPHKHEN